MTRVVVHIGAQRTGSEAIHRGLYANQDLLGRHGVLVPEAGRHDMSPHAVRHHPLAWSIDVTRQPAHDAQVWDALAEEIGRSDAETALLSSEQFAPIVADPQWTALLVERLERVSPDVTLVFFVREQLGLLNDLYRNRVKAFETTDHFDTYLEDSSDVELYDLRSFRQWLEDPPTRFVGVPWDPESGADALATLLEAAGIAVDPGELREPAETYVQNLGPAGVEANRLLGAQLRGSFPDFQPTEQAARRLRRRAATEALAQGWCGEDFWGWSPGQADRLIARYAESNEEFARRTWGGGWGLPLPLDRPRNVAALVELDPNTVQRVHRYVNTMVQTFRRLRAKQDAS